jgi:hypothetical protein
LIGEEGSVSVVYVDTIKLCGRLRTEFILYHNEFIGSPLTGHVRRRAVQHGVGTAAVIQVGRLRIHENIFICTLRWDSGILNSNKIWL